MSVSTNPSEGGKKPTLMMRIPSERRGSSAAPIAHSFSGEREESIETWTMGMGDFSPNISLKGTNTP